MHTHFIIHATRGVEVDVDRLLAVAVVKVQVVTLCY